MLDGLESEGTARVCVMMTAMNLQHLPPALVRSGRVELWLEMQLPDLFDRSAGADARSATAYFLNAADGVRENKQRYERAERAARMRPRMAGNPYSYGTPREEEE